MRAISMLPDADAPAIFGLPANIGRASERANSARIIEQLRTVARPDTLADAFDRKLWLAQLEPFLAQWKQLTAGRSLLDARPKLPSETAEPVRVLGVLHTHLCSALMLYLIPLRVPKTTC